MVKRYDFEINDETQQLEIIERQNGDYVEASQYDDLLEEVIGLRRIIKDAYEILRDA